ncbi:MAG: glycerophosphodiester phosphodiesterase, partial [Clostridiales Family XIII bacterium]|nr:glycerophosphodiester phosphodiesterase [Clostridiales Family XIII bacterium]
MEMEIWGHRGAYADAPENTLAGFALAAEYGAQGVEFDVQMTRDGETVVIHDETIDRVSNGRGYVKDHTLSELKRLNFNKRGITKPLFMEIPTLGEALRL